MPEQVCGLVPVYNNNLTLERVVSDLLQRLDRVIVVDDGSDDGSCAIADALAVRFPGRVQVRHLPRNRGKGAAVQAGLEEAERHGCSHVLQVDADGQHDLDDVPRFLDALRAEPRALVMGQPVFDDSIPAVRKYGRKLTHLMIALEAGSTRLPDAMCGFRVYPVAAIRGLGRMGARMCFDPEVMIRAHWAGIPIVTVPTRVRYPSAEEGGVSHFRMVHDNVLHVWTHTRLVLQAPLRWLLRWTRR